MMLENVNLVAINLIVKIIMDGNDGIIYESTPFDIFCFMIY
jgi:hypothetical protein